MERNENFCFLSFSAFPLWILAWKDAILVFFNFFNFLLFFWNFLFRVEQEQKRTLIFLFSLSQPFPTYFGLKWGHNGIFLIFWMVLLFFWNFILRVWTERQFLFSPFICLIQPILAWNKAIMVFFNFFNFLLFFSNFLLRVG